MVIHNSMTCPKGLGKKFIGQVGNMPAGIHGMFSWLFKAVEGIIPNKLLQKGL